MITKKEDLINTYIEDDHGELRGIYLSIAEKFGFLIDEGDYTLGIISVMKGCKYVQDINSIGLVRKCKKLTLSDLKPRTRTEYEKLTESKFDVWDLKLLLENGELFSRTSKGDYLPYSANAPTYMLMHFNKYGVYRKVEKPIEWWEDAAEFVKQFGHAEKLESNGTLLIEASMTRDQWCDFARILLEQEGE